MSFFYFEDILEGECNIATMFFSPLAQKVGG